MKLGGLIGWKKKQLTKKTYTNLIIGGRHYRKMTRNSFKGIFFMLSGNMFTADHQLIILGALV